MSTINSTSGVRHSNPHIVRMNGMKYWIVLNRAFFSICLIFIRAINTLVPSSSSRNCPHYHIFHFSKNRLLPYLTLKSYFCPALWCKGRLTASVAAVRSLAGGIGANPAL